MKVRLEKLNGGRVNYIPLLQAIRKKYNITTSGVLEFLEDTHAGEGYRLILTDNVLNFTSSIIAAHRHYILEVPISLPPKRKVANLLAGLSNGKEYLDALD